MKNCVRPICVSAVSFAVLLVGELCSFSQTQSGQYIFETIAGQADRGNLDGVATEALFYHPTGVTVDSSGNIYVSDPEMFTVRKITPAGIVSTIGSAGRQGTNDGAGSDARFSSPFALGGDSADNVFVADLRSIRRITPMGLVSTVNVDVVSSLDLLSGLAVDSATNVYVTTDGNTILKITQVGVVTVLAGFDNQTGSSDGIGANARFYSPQGVAVDDGGNVYVADWGNSAIRMITPSGTVKTIAGQAGNWGTNDGDGSAARFEGPSGISVDRGGNVYVVDASANTIRRISPAGAVSTLAGLPGRWGSDNGVGDQARFHHPSGAAVDIAGNIYVTDWANSMIRKITVTGDLGAVSTVAGRSPGSADGMRNNAQFDDPTGVALDSGGNLYVTDVNNSTVRRITPTGLVNTLAGLAGWVGSADGAGGDARFFIPQGVAVDSIGNVYVADSGNSIIRKITPTGVVSTLAGLALRTGSKDGVGASARFSHPVGIGVDMGGNVYVADTVNSTIRKITPAGVVTTLAGAAQQYGSTDGTNLVARFYFPKGIAIDTGGIVYVGDTGNHTIRKVTTDGRVTTLAGLAGKQGSSDGVGSSAQFNGPLGIAVDSTGHIIVADCFNDTIRIVTPGGVVTTLGGLAGIPGSTDGAGSHARFFNPSGVAVDSGGNIYITDSGGDTIRKGIVSTGDGVPRIVGLEKTSDSDLKLTIQVAAAAAGELIVERTDSFASPTTWAVEVAAPVTQNAAGNFEAHVAFGQGTRFFRIRVAQ